MHSSTRTFINSLSKGPSRPKRVWSYCENCDKYDVSTSKIIFLSCSSWIRTRRSETVLARARRPELFSDDFTASLSGIVANGFHPFNLLSSDNGTFGHVWVLFRLQNRSTGGEIRSSFFRFISLARPSTFHIHRKLFQVVSVCSVFSWICLERRHRFPRWFNLIRDSFPAWSIFFRQHSTSAVWSTDIKLLQVQFLEKSMPRSEELISFPSQREKCTNWQELCVSRVKLVTAWI